MANLRRVRSERSGKESGGARRGPRDRDRTPLPDGTVLRESASGREGRILEHACQYAHPQAAPVFHYLIRWDDGQVQALGEAALRPGHGIEIADGA